ncbi:NAD(P)-dependent oxidoreductase [Streptomyces sp. NPDC049879]|uniref:NAD(P)-dependent oxidoreductase n=1 Tax=Streptomyces sp. NPDC049879 TaxID=3365598 RepID=UPI0037AEAE58
MGNPREAHADVTVIGLGLMGRALAAAFLRAGHRTTVWNRTADRAAGLVAQGAAFAPTARDAATAAPLVVVCLADHDAVGQVIGTLGDALDGRTLLDLTSGTPAQARATAALAAARGAAAYLDGGIMAVPADVGTPGARVVCCGPRAAYERHAPALASLAGQTAHLGEEHGTVALYELAVTAVMWSALSGFLQGAALLGAAGVAAGAFVPFAREGVEAVAGWLPGYARQIEENAFPAHDVTVGTHLTSVRNLVRESEALGVGGELPRLIASFAERAVAAGHGGDGYAALIGQFGGRARTEQAAE